MKVSVQRFENLEILHLYLKRSQMNLSLRLQPWATFLSEFRVQSTINIIQSGCVSKIYFRCLRPELHEIWHEGGP